MSVWANNDDVWKTWSEQITVAEHDAAALAVDCLDCGQEYVTVGADGNIKVCKNFIQPSQINQFGVVAPVFIFQCES